MESSQSSPSAISSRSVKFVIVCVGLAILVIAMGLSLKIALSGFTSGGMSMDTGLLDEKTVNYGNRLSADKIAIIPVTGGIDGTGSHTFGTKMVYEVSRQLRQANEDSSVKAVVIPMDSPGGGLTASDLIHHEVKLLRQANKPVIVMVNGMAASGGLYISAPASYIIASPTSMIGSIGVIMNRFMVKELMEKIGIKPDVIKSTGMKDIGSPFREMSQEERKFFQDLIKSFNNRFISIVAEGRNMTIDEVSKLANGLIYTADEALEYKLIDQIDYFDAALDKAMEMAGLTDARFIRYEKPFDYKGVIERFGARSGLNLGQLGQMMGETEIQQYPELLAR